MVIELGALRARQGTRPAFHDRVIAHCGDDESWSGLGRLKLPSN